MTASEIENLATNYITGNMGEDERIAFELALVQDKSIKQRVDELLLAWNVMEVSTDDTVIGTMDYNFYTMLNNQAIKPEGKKVYTMRPMVYWLISTAAIIAFIIAFFVGKYAAPPHEIIKYKTVQILKPEPVQTNIVRVYLARSDKKKKKYFINQKSALIAKLQSAYSSKRISAVLTIGQHGLNRSYLTALDSVLKNDPDPNVQLAILQALRPKAGTHGVQEVLIHALPFAQGIVQSSIIDMLLEKKSKEAIPQMLTLLQNNSTDYHTQVQIELGIKEFLN